MDDFNNVIDTWIEDVERTSFDQLCVKPSLHSWSLGQVCVHLIVTTDHYLKQVSICLATDENATVEMSSNAKVMFRNNAIPDELIKGPPSNLNTPQPGSKEELVDGLVKLKEEIDTIGRLVSGSQSKGKTKHPGLLYFNAHEWLQFAEMHFRHHERQKKRIQAFLKMNR